MASSNLAERTVSDEDQAQPRGFDHGLGAALDAQLAQDCVHVKLGGVLADVESLRNFLV